MEINLVLHLPRDVTSVPVSRQVLDGCLETLGVTPDTRAGEMRQLEMAVESFLNHMPSTYDELLNCHDVRVRQVEHHILVSCHCVMKSELSITRVHDVTAALEDSVKERFPQISRVTIHPEPPEAS